MSHQLMVSWWVPYLPKGCRQDFNNGPGDDLNSGPILAPWHILESNSNNARLGHSNLVSHEVYISVQVSYLWFPGGYNDFISDVSKQINSACIYMKQSDATEHVDVVGSVNTVKLRCYGWSTSKDWRRWVSQQNKAKMLRMVAFLWLNDWNEWKKRKTFFSSADMSVEVWDQASGQNHVLQVENQFFNLGE